VAIGPGVLTADVPVGAVAAAERHTGTLALVRARSVAAIDALVNVLSPGRLDDTYTAAEPAAVAALAAAWRTAAATSASVAGDAAAAWGADPAGGLSTVPAPPPGLLPDAAGTAAQLRLTVLIEAKQRIAAGTAPEQALQHARQRAGRGAAGIGARTARTAHEHTLQAAGLGWARIPATNGCPWCLLLASRGPVYTSQRTAQGRVGPYHPWCRCRTLAVPTGTPLTGYLDPGSDVGALVDQAAAAWDATGTMDRYTTSPFARTQERARRGRTGPGRPPTAATPSAPTGPRLSDDDQARLNTANREANRLNAQAYRLQQQGRDAEATALRGQAAIHRAEAERITDTLRGSAVGPGRPDAAEDPSGDALGGSGRRGGGGSDELLRPLDDRYSVEIVTYPAGLGRDVPAPVDRQTKSQLESIDRIGVGREHLVTPQEHEAADWLEAGGLELISVDHTSPRHRLKYPDFAFRNADATLEVKSTSGSLPTIRKRLWEASRQSSRIVLDVKGSPAGSRDQILVLLREALRDYGADLDEVVVRGDEYVLRWWAGRAG
jgi:hypothetical protein